MANRSVAYVGLRLAVRGVPAFLFLWAGLTKAFDRQGSILAVNAYDVLPRGLVEPVALLLPWTEMAVAVLLILGLFTRFAGVVTASLAAVFIAGMSQAKARGLAIDCGCFGGGGPGAGVTWWDIARDVPLLLAGVYLAVRPRGPLQLDAYFDPEDEHDERIEGEAAPAGTAETLQG